MLTEYSSYDDIRKFCKKAGEKKDEMYKGWMGEEIYRLILKWKSDNNIKKKEFFYERTFKVDNQVVKIEACPVLKGNGDVNKRKVSFRMFTFIETNKGKICVNFSDSQLIMQTPHFQKRSKERIGVDCWSNASDEHKIPYTRNGRKYELHIYGNYVLITKKDKYNVLWYITILHRDMCTSKNYQELFERAGKAIDEHDIYEWK